MYHITSSSSSSSGQHTGGLRCVTGVLGRLLRFLLLLLLLCMHQHVLLPGHALHRLLLLLSPLLQQCSFESCEGVAADVTVGVTAVCSV